jgi:hypothetical protein
MSPAWLSQASRDAGGIRLAPAEPLLAQAEFGQRGFDMGRGEVTGAGQLDSFVAYALQQPSVRADHPRGCGGVYLARLVQAGFADQLMQFSLAGRCPGSTNELTERQAEAAAKRQGTLAGNM